MHDFPIYHKHSTRGYKLSSFEKLMERTGATILCESEAEQEILEGLQLILGVELDIRIIESASSMNPWTYNREELFYTFNPLQRI